ncbi:MAG TPA: lysyl oxidase family protein [Solirubrobacteraceae bacterium]
MPNRYLAACAVAAFTAAAAPAAAAADQTVGSLASGRSLYWNGPQVASARVDAPALCGTQGPCYRYAIRVTSAKAKLLRVALRTADDSNGWEVTIYDPSGIEAADGSTYTLHGVAEDFDVEDWVQNPQPGVWTVEVVPNNVKTGTFAMRAAVDPPIVWPASDPNSQTVHSSRTVRTCTRRRRGKRTVSHCTARRVTRTRSVRRTGVYAIPPDLAADAPWHLTFEQPTPMVVVESGNFLALAGFHNSSAAVADQPVYDCLPEETVQQGGHHCLRFTSGFANLGPGRFEVFGSSSTPVAVNGGPLYQDVYRSDGSRYVRPSGSFTFHQIHAHYHVLGIAKFELYPVLGNRRLGAPSDVLKEGFCLGDIKMYDWRSFAQAEVSPTSPDNCEPSAEPDGSWRFYEGIDPGWEDSYKWQTSGQFVNFGNSPDGLYLLRVTVNPFHYILEADSGHETNDVAYTYFRVTGNDIHVLERGHGASPWDPHKQVENPVFGDSP